MRWRGQQIYIKQIKIFFVTNGVAVKVIVKQGMIVLFWNWENWKLGNLFQADQFLTYPFSNCFEAIIELKVSGQFPNSKMTYCLVL